MFDFLCLNAILFLFFLLSIVESQWKFELPKTANETPLTLLTGKRLFLFILAVLPLIIFFVLFSPRMIIRYYLLGSFSALLVGHALISSLNRTKLWKAGSLLVAGMVIALRLIFPSTFSHNLFLILSIVWLGPFFVGLKILTVKRFVLISLIWFAYDIFYVWLTPLAHNIDTATRMVGFPLSVAYGESWIGTGDLLWANLLISLLPGWRWKTTGIILLVGSNILLKLFDLLTDSINLFPLLVLWVPIGITVIFLGQRKRKFSSSKPALDG